MSSYEFNQIMRKLDHIIADRKVKVSGKWISEEEAMLLTGLTKNSLYRKRKNFEFHYSTATGRKIKYLRTEIMKYLDENSTVIERPTR